ncbi:g8042 [Coccomyxa viridis]|uniref:G8042 protein n=1 Tax=Coccomyxa viridis TaxID=1274662 RepID=A0ABP1FZF3_9CHLO
MATLSPTIKGDKLICLGKTYLLHAKELGDAVPDRPVLFLKPPSAAVFAAEQNAHVPVELVKGKGDVHYEAEVVLRLNEALEVDAVTLGLDLTLRDLQAKLKRDGHPWEIAKAFPNSAVVGPWVDVQSFPDYRETEFTFTIDGQERQRGALTQTMYSTDDAVAMVRDSFTLVPGDIIFTGTPHGVGVIAKGQQGRLQWGEKLSYDVIFQ